MKAEHLTARLRNLEGHVDPRPAFVEQLHDELAARLDFPAQDGIGQAPQVTNRRHDRTPVIRRLTVFAAAVLLLIGLLANSAALGALVDKLLNPVSLLDQARSTGAIKVIIGSGPPQVQTPTRGIDGFDVDVAEALAGRLGIRADIRFATAEEIITAPGSGWQIALPGVGIDPVATSGLIVTQPYYRWPIYLVALRGSESAGGLVPGALVCVVSGSPGAAWANGSSTGPALDVLRPAMAMTLVLETDEAACVARVEGGEVDAMVTTTLLPADLDTAGTLALIVPSPVAVEPRVVAVPAVPGGPPLRDALDRAIARFIADGTLADLARTRLGTDSVVDSRQR